MKVSAFGLDGRHASGVDDLHYQFALVAIECLILFVIAIAERECDRRSAACVGWLVAKGDELVRALCTPVI